MTNILLLIAAGFAVAVLIVTGYVIATMDRRP